MNKWWSWSAEAQCDPTLDATLEIRGSPRFNHIFNDIYSEKNTAELYACVQERMLSICFKETFSISQCLRMCFCIMKDSFVSFQCCRKRKRWIHYHLVKYECRHVVQQRNSNVSWKIYCFCHKILMHDFTKTFRQVVSINETNKQTSIQCTGNKSQHTDLSANMGQSVWRLHKNINIRYLK